VDRRHQSTDPLTGLLTGWQEPSHQSDPIRSHSEMYSRGCAVQCPVLLNCAQHFLEVRLRLLNVYTVVHNVYSWVSAHRREYHWLNRRLSCSLAGIQVLRSSGTFYRLLTLVMRSSTCVHALSSKGAATCKTYISSSESNSFSLVNSPCTTYSACYIRLTLCHLILVSLLHFTRAGCTPLVHVMGMGNPRGFPQV
jgi:hypothetical protein